MVDYFSVVTILLVKKSYTAGKHLYFPYKCLHFCILLLILVVYWTGLLQSEETKHNYIN